MRWCIACLYFSGLECRLRSICMCIRAWAGRRELSIPWAAGALQPQGGAWRGNQSHERAQQQASRKAQHCCAAGDVLLLAIKGAYLEED